MDEDEAKSIASHWVRRLEESVLSKVYDNTTLEDHDIVTYEYRNDKSTSSLPKPSPDYKITSDSTNCSPRSSRRCESLLISPTKTSVQEGHNNSTIHSSPRVNLESLRRKRLEHFGNQDKEAKIYDREELVESDGHYQNNQLQFDVEESHFTDEYENWKYRTNDFTSRSDEDDKLRLELWGLRGAVESGQLDIKSYIHPLKDHCQNIIPKPSKTQTIDKTPAELSSLHQGSLYPSNRDFNYNLSDISTSSGDFPDNNREVSSEDNLNQLASMLSIETPCWGRGKVDHSPKEDFTSFSVSKNRQRSPFGWPVPQIEGNLYNGFETSDSESSIKVNSTSVKPTNEKKSFDLTTSTKQPKSSRGKQKILSELTEFIDERKNKKVNNENFNTKPKEVSPMISSTNGLPDTNCSAVDFILKGSSPRTPQGSKHSRNHVISPLETMYLSSSAPTVYNRDYLGLENQLVGDERSIVDLQTSLSNSNNHIYGKTCPTCQEVNSKAANWCIECGTALIAVKPTVLDQEQFSNYQKHHQEMQKFIDDSLGNKKDKHCSFMSKKERELKQDVINLSKDVEKNSGFSTNESLQSSVTSYKRRWLKSSLAWSTYEPQELSKPPSTLKASENKGLNKGRFIDGSLRSRSSSDLAEKTKKKNKSRNGWKSSRRQRSTSATYSEEKFDNLPINFDSTNKKSPKGSKVANRHRPGSAKQHSDKRSTIRSKNVNQHKNPSPRNTNVLEEQSSPDVKSLDTSIPHLNLDDVGSYDRILTLIRSQRDAEPVPYLYLPDEILLEIFTNLSNKDLISCACVCSQFYRIAMDETLWRTIIIRKNRNVCDEWLDSIGNRHPSSLTISQCSSSKVSSEGLRSMFRKCSETLEEVDFSGCSGGELIGESILLHISVRCFNVVSVDVSWTNVSDNGVQELANNLKRLECLCLNGCQAITDKSLTTVSKQHGESLRIFEVFGCFNITPAGLLLFGSQCIHLQTLNIGQCHKMTDAAVGNLVSHLPEIENLDLRGCKQTRDSAVKKIVRNCPHLQSLVLANCPLITDSTLTEISSNLAGIKSLDICGCSYITDAGVRALARCCHKLEVLDLSSTGTAVTSKSIVALSNYCSQSLRVLKLSFCADISVNTVNQVVKNCKKLTLLHLYGCKRIKDVEKIKNINPNLVIEK